MMRVSALAFAACCACANLGPYVWAEELPAAPQAAEREYRLMPGDTVSVRVFNQDSLSGRNKIRPDGRITVPFANDVEAAGHTTTEVAKQLTLQLKDFLNQPVVTVALEEVGQTSVSVVGEVARPGIYPLERGQGVLRALAAAGGLTEFAHHDRIFVMRAGRSDRIRFSLDNLSRPGSRSSSFRLENDDVIAVQ